MSVYHTKSIQKPSLKNFSPLRYGDTRSQVIMNITHKTSIVVVMVSSFSCGIFFSCE